MRARGWNTFVPACLVMLSVACVEAATFTVTTTNDTSDVDLGDGICADINGQCSLRAAIMQANYTNVIGASNTIIIPPGVYKLTRPGNDDSSVIGDLDIAQPMTIQGAGPGLTIIDGNGAVTGDRVFQILSSAGEISLSGMTVRNGMKVAGAFDSGGGLYWEGSGSGHLRLSDMIFENNSARYGGGLSLNYAPYIDGVTMSNVTVRGNTATTGAGGGVAVVCVQEAVFELQNSQIYSNAAFQGGGLSLQSSDLVPGFASLRIENTGINFNTATHDAGFDNAGGETNVPVVLLNSQVRGNMSVTISGGIGNYGALVVGATTVDGNRAGMDGAGLYNLSALVTLTNSTISGNVSSNGGGGGIFNDTFGMRTGVVNLTNCTISGNSAASGSGGGIFNANGLLTLLNCTIAANSAPAGNGGGVTNSSSGTMSALGTIIASNSASGGPDFGGVLVFADYDLFGNSSGVGISGFPFACQFNVNPGLGPLQDNGGPTWTHALLPGSPAIDAGRSIGLSVDQRGAPRPVDDPAIPNSSPGDGSDLGAFELGRPKLAIQDAGGAAVLSWPWYYGGFAVQATTNLAAGNAWATVVGTPVVNGTSYLFTNTAIANESFYRLKSR